MKKFLVILIFVFIFSTVNAINPKKILTPIPSDFKPECYKSYKKVKMTDIFWDGDTYKLLVNKNDLLITHFWFILPYKRINDNFIIIKRFYDSYIELYSDYGCSWSFDVKAKEYNNIIANKTTKVVIAKLSDNHKYGIYNKKDFDNDWVEDKKDNCPYRYNPLQIDTNLDWVWDACMDDDKDHVIWIFDNCPNIFNPAWEDKNWDWVWDVCEFDKDKDWIFDIKDNCPDISNSDQKDSDGDNIWDICDNCKFYNPAQLDYNKNWIGDICDTMKSNKIKEEEIKKEKELLKIDKDKDWILNEKDNCIGEYNPDQKDIDKDWIGDTCDKSDDRFIEQNKWLFKIILFLVSIFITSLIFFLMNKRKK